MAFYSNYLNSAILYLLEQINCFSTDLRALKNLRHGWVWTGWGKLLLVLLILWFIFNNCPRFCSFPVFRTRLLSSTITLPKPTILFYPVMVSFKTQRNYYYIKWEPKNKKQSVTILLSKAFSFQLLEI